MNGLTPCDWCGAWYPHGDLLPVPTGDLTTAWLCEECWAGELIQAEPSEDVVLGPIGSEALG